MSSEKSDKGGGGPRWVIAEPDDKNMEGGPYVYFSVKYMLYIYILKGRIYLILKFNDYLKRDSERRFVTSLGCALKGFDCLLELGKLWALTC